MADSYYMDEATSGVINPYHESTNYVKINNSAPTLEPHYLLSAAITIQPNLKSGMVAFHLDTIVQNQDLMNVRGCIKKIKRIGSW